jgi:hypothetical protein
MGRAHKKYLITIFYRREDFFVEFFEKQLTARPAASDATKGGNREIRAAGG